MKIGVIGCGGRISKIIRLLLNEVPEIKIKFIYDVSKESINKFKNEFGKELIPVKNYNTITEDPEIEWIFIGSPNYAHRNQIIASLKNSKNIFSEKPIATSFKELEEIQKMFQKKGKKFLVSYPLRYSPHYKKIKEILESGKIGKIISFEFNETLSFNHGAAILTDWRRLEKFSGGHILEKCCHDFDITNLLIKSLPTKIASFGGLNLFTPENKDVFKKIKLNENQKNMKNPFLMNKDVVDNQVVILEYRNGVRATFHTNCASTMPERRIYICGTNGTLKADVLKGIVQVKTLESSETITIIDEEFKGGHGAGDTFLVNQLITAIKNDKENFSSLNDGIKSAAIALGAEKSRKENKVFNLETVWKKLGY